MTQYQIAIIALLIAQAFTLYLLWGLHSGRDQWREAWLRDSAELLYWKRNGILRDPLTGKYRKKYDVRNFGAVGDGVTDDTKAIQAALDASPRKVFIPEGKYRTTAPLIVKGK